MKSFEIINHKAYIEVHPIIGRFTGESFKNLQGNSIDHIWSDHINNESGLVKQLRENKIFLPLTSP